MYAILDFNAVIKHTYYGCDDREAIFCEQTGRRFATWKAAANSFLSRYLEPILLETSPRFLWVAHDMGSEYRKAIYPEYKANRAKVERSPVEEEQLEHLKKWAKNLFTAIGATQIGVKGVEADDVIAWLCAGMTDAKSVYTVDGDLVQLANDKTIVYLKGEPFFGEGEYKGVPYHLISLAKSITGDTSDNFPGVKGLGPAKIEKLLADYGVDGLEQLQAIVDSGNTADLDEAIAETNDKILIKLREEFSTWRTMWKLAKLNPALCWKPRAKRILKPAIHKRVPSATHCERLLREVGGEDIWEATLEAMMPRKIAVTAENWEEYREAILEEMGMGDIVAFDYETADPEPIAEFVEASASGDNFVDMLSHRLTGASFCFGAHLENVIYVPVNHKDSPNLPPAVIGELVSAAGEVSTRVAQNTYFEGIITQTNLGLELRDVLDTRIMQRYYDENAEADLKAMSLAYLGYEQATFEETLAAGNGGQGVANMSELTLDEVFSYGIDDAHVTALLFDLLKVLLQLDGQWEFYRRWAVNPTVVLQHSYINGVDIDWNLQAELHERDKEQFAEGLAELRQILDGNVTGEVTEGCKSFVEAEKDYVYRSAKKKADGDTEKASTALYKWKKKLERSCTYIPYREETVMPAFAFTPKQLTAATEVIGLKPVEKVTQAFLGDYLQGYGMVGFGVEGPSDPAQREFLEALAGVMANGGTKIAQLEKAESPKLKDAVASMDRMAEVCQRLAGVQPKVIKLGDELNVGSPQQMQQLLYCKIGVPVRLRGKTAGKGRLIVGIKEAGPSTDETAIETAIANDIEKGSWQEQALRALLKAKSANTRISLYHEKYPLWKHRDGKIHPTFTDAGTDTRRPTGSSPNVLQVSKKDKAMRSQFVPPHKDWVCVAIDYASQEIRLMACEANDPVMISVYDPANEKDLHSMTGSGIAKMKAASGSKDMAQIAEYGAFDEARNDEGHPLHKLASAVRKHAKGCIAAGSLVLTDKGLVPIDFITLDHKVWDGVEFVSHEGLEYKGEQEVITVGPLTATPDHEVYLNDGRAIPLGRYATQQAGPGLAIGEVAGAAARYSESYQRDMESVRRTQRSSDGDDALHSLWGDEGASSEQPAPWAGQAMQMPAEEMGYRGAQDAVGSVPLDGSAVQQPGQSVVQELRRPGNHAELQQCGRVCGVDAGEPASQELPRRGDRQEGQQQGVCTGQPSSGLVSAEPVQHTQESVRGIPRREGSMDTPVGLDKDGPSGVSVRPEDRTEMSGEGDTSTGHTIVSAPLHRRTKVYDIINAGPRHRFTVSGVIVHNCNFGLAYGAGAATLSRNLIVPIEEADALLSGTMKLYNRIPVWQQETAKFMEKNGYTLTAFGTKRHATDDVFSSDRGKSSRQHRQGTNATIQGSAAEMLRIVLTRIVERELLNRLRMVFFAPIYDEVVAFVHKDDVVEYCKEMDEIMRSATPPGHVVPQVPEFSIGPDWGRVHELGRWPGEEAIQAMVDRCLTEAAELRRAA